MGLDWVWVVGNKYRFRLTPKNFQTMLIVYLFGTVVIPVFSCSRFHVLLSIFICGVPVEVITASMHDACKKTLPVYMTTFNIFCNSCPQTWDTFTDTVAGGSLALLSIGSRNRLASHRFLPRSRTDHSDDEKEEEQSERSMVAHSLGLDDMLHNFSFKLTISD